MNEFLLIAGMVLVTFAIRYSMFGLAGRVQFPDWLVNALRYVPPVVLTVMLPAREVAPLIVRLPPVVLY